MDEQEKTPAENYIEFLENAPLYTPTLIDTIGRNVGQSPSKYVPTAISRACDRCKKPSTTWKMVGEGTEWGTSSVKGFQYEYVCAQCEQRNVWFWLEYIRQKHDDGDVIGVMKVGQFPPWDISTPSELRSEASETSRNFFRRGQINFSQGYGIGALSYMRRVVEDEAKAILDLLEEVAKDDQDDGALKAISEARKSRRGTEMLELVKEALPPSLRVKGGHNPLQVLWDDCSIGIHRLSEEECLEIAAEIRDTLVFVLRKIKSHRNERREYQERVQRRASSRPPKLTE